MAGRYEDAINEGEQSAILQGEDREKVAKVKQALIEALRGGGPKGYWSKIMEITMKEKKKGENVQARDLAFLYTQVDERDEAFKWLDKACDNKEGDLVWLKVSPYWDKLRDDPRYMDILRRLKLAE
jgi:hypothetical protein